jgi:hypothetical protein
LAGVRIKRKWGFINTNGEAVISPTFDNIGTGFKEDLCFVRKNNSIGVIDLNGNTRTPFVFRSGLLGDCFEYFFKDGLAYVSLNTEIGTINDEGLLIERKSNTQINVASIGFIDTNGKTRVPFKYQHAWHFNEGLAPVFSNEGAGYINQNAEVVIPPIFKDALPFKEGFAIVSK